VDEATVCEATKVSRTPAREAFNRLEGEGFLTLVPRKGAQVKQLNSSDLYDAYGARFMIESFAATDFCATGKPVPDQMHEQLRVMDELTDFADAETHLLYGAADQAFHAALVETLSNRAITQFFESLWRINRWGLIARSNWLRSEAFVTLNRCQHHDLVRALTEHDGPAATSVLRDHLRMTFAEAPAVPV
jgi:DNA-binding GntR family transcriptional regulator